MAGPPLAPSSNVNMRMENKTEAEPCPKRRRKSLDDSNPADDLGQEAPAEGAPKHDDDAEEAGEASAAATEDRADETEQHAEQDRPIGGGEIDEEEEKEEEEEVEEEEEEEEGAEEGEDNGEVEDEAGLRDEEMGGLEGPGEGGPGDAEEDGGATSPAGKEEEEGKPDGSKIARARSAWMLFLADNREKVRKEHPGLAVGPMQKILSEMWKGLGEEEVARYAKLAVEDKERMNSELAAAGLTKLPAKNSSAASAPGGPTSLVLPLARVRKAVRLDPAVGNISKEGLLLVAKATEVFMTVMADHAWKIGRQTGRKSIRPCDVADFVFAAPEMYWLKDEFREERSSAKRQSKPEASSARADLAKKAVAAAMPKGAKPITSFFQKA
eukprot:g3273.t1